jgi:hypothetical protein
MRPIYCRQWLQATGTAGTGCGIAEKQGPGIIHIKAANFRNFSLHGFNPRRAFLSIKVLFACSFIGLGSFVAESATGSLQLRGG